MGGIKLYDIWFWRSNFVCTYRQYPVFCSLSRAKCHCCFLYLPNTNMANLGYINSDRDGWLRSCHGGWERIPAHMVPCLWCIWASIHFRWKSMFLQNQIVSVWPEVLFIWDYSLMRPQNPSSLTHTQLIAIRYQHPGGCCFAEHRLMWMPSALDTH